MEGNKLLTLLVTITVGIIFIGALLAPVIEDNSETEKKYTNDGFFNATYLNDKSTDVLSYDYTNPTILTINGNDVDMSSIDSSYSSVTVAFSDKWFVRYVITTNTIYLYETDTVTSPATFTIAPEDEKNVTLTCSNGTATFVVGEDTYTKTISGDGLIISSSEKAEYVMKKSATAAYVNGDSLVYGAGRTDRALGVTATSYNAIFKASVDDGVSAIGFSPNTYTITDSSVTATDISGSVLDLYELTKFTISITDGENNGTVTYNQIFVPRVITAELSQHLDAGEIAILAAVPLMAIAALVLLVVRYFVAGRN